MSLVHEHPKLTATALNDTAVSTGSDPDPASGKGRQARA
jgi:hypothetical protein